MLTVDSYSLTVSFKALCVRCKQTTQDSSVLKGQTPMKGKLPPLKMSTWERHNSSLSRSGSLRNRDREQDNQVKQDSHILYSKLQQDYFCGACFWKTSHCYVWPTKRMSALCWKIQNLICSQAFGNAFKTEDTIFYQNHYVVEFNRKPAFKILFILTTLHRELVTTKIN